jgi:hypothetical protein
MRVLVLVNHNGRQFIAGKTVIVRGDLIFYNQSERARWYRPLNSPYGVDAGLLNWMEAMKVKSFHHFVRSKNRLYVARVDDIARYGVYREDEGRQKVFLPIVKWQERTGRNYDVPFVRDEITINAFVVGSTEFHQLREVAL